MKLVIYNRDFTDRVQGELSVTINEMSFERLGGCKEMRAIVKGKDEVLLAMINDLRCPVELYDDNGMAVWWGFIYEVLLDRNGVGYGNSLDKLYNRARVDYTEPDSTTVNSTAFASAAASITTYGYKEIIHVMSDVNVTTAELKRASILTNYANPTPNFSINKGSGNQAELLCRGWADTLNWQIVESVPSIVGVAYDTLGTNIDDVNAPVFQQVVIPAGNNLFIREVALYLNMFDGGGSVPSPPTDNLIVALYATLAGVPTGAALGSVTITPAELNTYAERIVKQFATPVELTAGATYALHLSRSGGEAYTSGYFVVATNTALGYTDGYYRWWNQLGGSGAGWYTASPDVDMVFALYADEWIGAARQIAEVIDSYAQFITGIADLSGCTDSEVTKFYPGNTTTWQVLSEYFDLGGANGRELIVAIDIQRRLAVSEEPAAMDGATFFLGLDGTLTTKANTPVELSDLWGVSGQYVKLREDQFAELSAVSQSIIEEVRWSPAAGVRVILKGQIRVEDLGL